MVGERTFRADLRMGLGFPSVLSVLGVVLSFCFDNFESLRGCWRNPYIYRENSVNCVVYYVFNSFSFGGVFSQYFCPMLAAVPLACSYCVEKQGRLLIYKVTRCGRIAYTRSKFLSASLLGGGALALGTLLFMLVLGSFLPVVTPQKLLESDWIPYFDALNTGNGTAYLGIILYIVFLNGCLWSSVGLCASAFFPNRYVALSAPLVAQFLLMELERMLKLPGEFRLCLLMSARTRLYSDGVTLAVLTGTVLFLIFVLHRVFAKKVERGLLDAS